MFTNIIIMSERLKQIPITEEYGKEIFKELNEEVTTYMYPKPAEKIEDTIKFINWSIEGLKKGSNLQMVVLDKETGEFLGCAGLHNTDRKDPELGIWIKKSAHHKGYGLEAMGAIINWGMENIDFEYIKYPVDKRNFASRRIPEIYGGVPKKEYKELSMTNKELDLIEYWIYK